MKLARLLLQAFGPFTGKVIDFSVTDVDFHLVYGPNEAGKSSALRAMTDLRFGIPLRSADDFIHASNELRIGAVCIDEDGARVGFMWRKGRGQTLSCFNTETGNADDALPLLPAHERGLTGGLERSEFERMFGLDHRRLREGGNLLLHGEGELGAALFEASAGIRGIASLLSGIDADARSLYNPHGRAQNAVINEARRQLDEQRQILRQTQTKPADWQTLHRAHETTKGTLDEITQALERLRRRENELTELRTVEPLLRDHDRTVAELDGLADVSDLPENARELRHAAEQASRRALQDLQDGELELARCAEALASLTIETQLLKHAQAIERIAASVDGAARSRIEAQQQQAVIAQIDGELTTAAAQVAPGRNLQEILQANPSAADRVTLDRHLQEITRLTDRLQSNQQRREELDQDAKLDSDEPVARADSTKRHALMSALKKAQGLGDVARQSADYDRQINQAESRVTQSLADLKAESVQALRAARPLLEAEIRGARQDQDATEEAVRALRNEAIALERDLEQQRVRERQLSAEGEVVTAETLRLARERRDRGWTSIRRAYIERSEELADLERDFDPEHPLPEAFEIAQSEAERQADLLRADAKRAASFEECAERISQMEDRRLKITSELAELATREEARHGKWLQHLLEAGLPPHDPEALREWQAARLHVLELADRVTILEGERAQVLSRAEKAATALATALDSLLGDVGDVGPTTAAALPDLIERTVDWEKNAAQLEAEHSARAKTARTREAEQKKVRTLIDEAQEGLKGHSTALQVWHARLFLQPDTTPEAIKARLQELDGLGRQAAALSEARLRKAHHQVVVDDLATQAGALAALLGETAPSLVDDFAERLCKRLATARDADQTRVALLADQKRAEDKKRIADAERAEAERMLSQLCEAAGIAAVERLAEAEEKAARKRALQSTLKTLRQQLPKASARSTQELRASLVDQDAVGMDSERERCRADISRRENEQTAARQAEEHARRALEAIDASDAAARAREAMESAAARYSASIRPWARLRLAHALLQEALNRFRERAQAPMVERASVYFSLMTGGRYTRLIADEAGGKPILLAEREDGVRIGLDAMSDGTSDQLYLALRIAALDLRRASHPHMPLVLDDERVACEELDTLFFGSLEKLTRPAAPQERRHNHVSVGDDAHRDYVPVRSLRSARAARISASISSSVIGGSLSA